MSSKTKRKMTKENGWNEYKKLILTEITNINNLLSKTCNNVADFDKKIIKIEININTLNDKLDSLIKKSEHKFDDYDALKWKIIGGSIVIATMIPIIMKIIFKL